MRRVFIDWEINLIQQIRLIHALAEIGIPIALNNSEIPKFKYLCKRFNFSISPVTPDVLDVTEKITLDHNKPLSQIGTCERSLVFPHALVTFCKDLWTKKKGGLISFSGLLTPERAAVLQEWTRRNSFNREKRWIPPFLSHKRYSQKTAFEGENPNAFENSRIGRRLILWSSNKGRRFPTKAWDPAYFELLAKSQFSLCPNGDFIWTYRFFEAILCGAIPIVQDPCPLYEPFHYFRMSQKLDSLEWTREIANHNFNKCVEMVTIPRDQIYQELLAEMD